MSQGKYSPVSPYPKPGEFIYNALGEVPPDYQAGVDTYDEVRHFGNYDTQGYDSYGYSAFFKDGSWAGHGSGVDRMGCTEMEYLNMGEDE